MRIVRFLLMVVVAVSSSFAAIAQNEVQSMVDKLNEGVKFYNEKKFPEAIAAFKKTLDLIKVSEKSEDDAIIKMSKDTKKYIADTYREEGRSYAKAANYDKAKESFKKAVKAYDQVLGSAIDKNKCEDLIVACYSVPATVKIKAKDYSGAIAILDKGILENKNALKLYVMKAQSLDNMKKTSEALAMYKTAIEVANSSNRLRREVPKITDLAVSSQLKAANDFSKNKKYAQAIECINTAVKIKPSPEAELLRVRVYSSAGNHNEVIKVAPAAIAAQTNQEIKSQIYFILAGSYFEIKDNAKALENYKKVTVGSYVPQAKDMIKKVQEVIEAMKKQ